jgi:hypothetical protein
MNPDEHIAKLEETRNEVIRFTNELDEKLSTNQMDGIQYHVMLHEKLGGKTKEEIISYIDRKIEAQKIGAKKSEENQKRKRTITFSAAAAILLLMIGIGIFYNNPGITGYTTATREVQESITYNQVFDTYTETQLDLNKITSLKITGTLEGTKAIVKLRINDIDYVVAEIVKPQDTGLITGMVVGEEQAEEQPQYILTTDKTTYALGETATLIMTPEAENKSLYINHGEEMRKLEQGSYTPTEIGEYQAIAIITLENDIIKAETNFTVVEEVIAEEPMPELTNQTGNETNKTNETAVPPEQPATTYEFTALCLETCNLPETTNPILIVELEPDSKLTINSIIIIQNKENEAPLQTRNMPDITLAAGQTTEIDLNEHFTDPDGDVVQYDMNEIPEISSAIKQNLLVLNGTTPGIYTAYIYATDGDKLTTSNTFQIIIQEGTGLPTNETTPETNTTTNETNITSPITTDPCSNPDINQRPSSCFIGIEEDLFESLTAQLQDNNRKTIGLFTRFGNLIIRGLLIQGANGEPNSADFQLGYTQPEGFGERITHTAWIDSETGNLYLRGQIFENQEILDPAQFNTFIIRNKFGMILGYFDELKGDLYLRGNIVQLGRI